ncbi:MULTISPECIES: TIGR03915 family putative DNA repair protein [Aequorivita]|uniref:TIGR03915 family putative DNA repair protein n=1 Tax=Aequorivita iocasae TaxID=2803865 RepID=A0ABX7DSX3_9FLAO|nr:MULTISPECIES: TIGR03915 family putative DNA repair protein [Aequorivita]QQX77256.1 TIGR03915 family putative DNA repair protein [Aequorivita iocasae]UCA56745.1 TIGR03915 family putative DNA repair protein [Aequorivita sp. F7]
MKFILIYDGSFEGLLSAVFYFYEHKLDDASIVKKENSQPSFLYIDKEIITDYGKAKRVWKGLSKKVSVRGREKIYKAFLSEIPTIENAILHFIKRTFSSEVSIENDYSDPIILEIDKVSKKVDREKHRMDAFVRFRLTNDGIYFATIEPDFNVLPLNMEHFKKRYADQKWLIYDLKRKYGIFYNLQKAALIELEISAEVNSTTRALTYFTVDEMHFQKLWGIYFKNSNIPTRKNMRLHIKHIPKRYWKYLPEKKF